MYEVFIEARDHQWFVPFRVASNCDDFLDPCTYLAQITITNPKVTDVKVSTRGEGVF
jgi:hypothetical protein